MKLISIILLTVALFLESALTTLPLSLLVLLSITSLYKNNFIFVLAFIFGILLDLFTLKTIGLSSIFFISFVYLILVYQTKFEIKTNLFIALASFVGSFVFLMVRYGNINYIIETFASVIIGLLIFVIVKRFSPIVEND